MSSLLPSSVTKNVVFDGTSEPEFHLYEDHLGARKVISSTKLPCFFCFRNAKGHFCATAEPVRAYAIFDGRGCLDVFGSMATVKSSMMKE